jgi:uncharacterized protein
MLPPAHSALLLVDGYNIIGAWPRLQRLQARHGLDSARQDLVETLCSYAAFQGYNTQVVFDAHFRDQPRCQEQVTKALVVCYTDFGETADSFIERTCAVFFRQQRQPRHRLIVATSDRAQRLLVTGLGAECISAHRLAVEVESSQQHLRQTVYRQVAQSPPKGRLSQQLGGPVRQRLEALRRQLPDLSTDSAVDD